MNFYRFPWKIFFRTFLIQFFSLSLVMVSALYILNNQFQEHDRLITVVSLFGLLVLISFLMSYQFARPLHKLLIKTLHISSKKKHPFITIDKDELFEEEIGEYSDLERALNRIDQKLIQRKEKLLRERDENQAFFNSVEEGLVSLNLDQKILFFNLKFENLFIPPEVKRLPHLALTDVFRQPEIHSAIERVIVSKETDKISLSLPIQKDTRERHFLISLAPLRRNKSQEVYGVLGTFHDITDIKLTEQIRIDFVGNASHELRTPLTSIKGYIETLKADLDQGNSTEARRFADVISKNVNRLIDLVNDLLSLSSLDASTQIHSETFHPLELTHSVIEEFKMQANSKSIRIDLLGTVDLVHADAGKVEQVLRNLISNALKYVSEGKNIRVIWQLNPLNEVQLKVIDNGPGISPEHHLRLFERFYRADRGRSRDQGGTGLGLAIVKHIMQNHGGRVEVNSQLGQGSEFICTFPPNPKESSPNGSL